MTDTRNKRRFALVCELSLLFMFACGTGNQTGVANQSGGSAGANSTAAPGGGVSGSGMSPAGTSQSTGAGVTGASGTSAGATAGASAGGAGGTIAAGAGTSGMNAGATAGAAAGANTGGAAGTMASADAGASGTPAGGGSAGSEASGAGGSSGMGGTPEAAGMAGVSGMPSGGSEASTCPAEAAGTGEPVLVSTIDLRGASGCPGLRLGDINGDGRMEIVVGQGVDQDTLDSYTPQRVVAVTAFDLKGELLWQYGTPGSAHIATSDIPIQVYDLDGDGKAEVFANMSTTEMTVLDGTTGEVQRRIPLPAAGSNDSIQFANLRGTDWPQDIIVKTRYSQFWAITGVDTDLGPAGSVLWTHEKGPPTGFSDQSTGHYALVYDWNGDGKDEVMGGYDFMDSEGNTQWSVTTLQLHADTIFTGDMDQDPSDGYEIVVCGDVAAAFEWETGERIWQDTNTVEIQQGGMGEYRKDIPGLEVALLDRLRTDALGLKSNNWLMDQFGNVLAREDRPNNSGWLTVTENLNNWDGQGNDFIFSYRREEGVLLYNGNLETVATFPYNGPSPENFAQHADLCGDGKEEVIVYDEQTAWIYANGGCDLDAPPCQTSLPQQYHLYNWSIYTGWITPDVKFYTPGAQP